LRVADVRFFRPGTFLYPTNSVSALKGAYVYHKIEKAIEHKKSGKYYESL